MLIRELEKDTGLERATIRFYEKEGLITPIRHENGYREYSQEDRETLLKVKLLRQLGMPLEMIRGLQQGSEDFSTALSDQINALEHKIQDTDRAKDVCIELRDSGTTYENLDAAHYLHELTKTRPAEPRWTPQPVPEFRQTAPTHPWRRYFARAIDLSIVSAIRSFLLIAVLRIRPVNDFIYTFLGLSICTHLISIPIEGLLLHFWGSTPGKWIMGIRVESVNGGKLSIRDAMLRSWNVLRYGYGFTVPIYEWWRLYQCHKDYTLYGYTSWDQESNSELQFQYYYDTGKKLTIAAIAMAYLFTLGLVLNESILPVNRGEDLTVAQIAQNHNDYLEMFYDDEDPPISMYLNADGTWREDYGYHYSASIVTVGGSAVEQYSNYVFEVDEHGFVDSIIFEQNWTDIFMLAPVGTRQNCTIIAVACAQDWMDLQECYEFADALSAALMQENGQFSYENLEFIWSTEKQNCYYSGGRYYIENSNETSAVYFRLEIKIHRSQ